MENKEVNTSENPNRMMTWLKRLGIAGFLFFLGKGLMWIALFYFGFRFTGCES
ncbi:MAG TPA: hypothetical protein PLQ78_05800 [Flavipsychrobacter sp.]|jgi:hypothetical protein|nr:MAG: alanyl-tRNA synthetase [Bacteroidia bacterium]HQE12240.1 hypothetical protein [Flavipsychrobacter sp.]